MSFEIQLPELGTIDGKSREARFVTLENKLRSAAGVVDRFNARVLNTVPVLQDCQWLALTTDLLISTKAAPDLELGESFNGATLTGLLRRLAVVMPDILLHPLLSTERGELPKVPTWNGQELANPFLEELSDLPGIMEDRLYVEKNHPELAEVLKLQARGGPSHREYFETVERDAALKAGRSYSDRNPFLPSGAVSEPTRRTLEDEKLIVELHRSNRTLAEQLDREARLPGVNPFGRRLANATIGMKFHKTDPKMGALLEAAASFEEVQLAAELAAADEALKKAALAASQQQRAVNMARRGR